MIGTLAQPYSVRTSLGDERSEQAWVSAPLADVRPGRLDAQRQGDHRRVAWPQRVGVDHLAHRRAQEPDADRLRRAQLEGPIPYLILDTRYEKVRAHGSVRSRAA